MNEPKRYVYNLLSLAIYLVLTLPGWIREYPRFSATSSFGNWAPVLIILLILVWISFHNLLLVDKFLSNGHYLKYSLALTVSIGFMAFVHRLIAEPFSMYWAFINILVHTALCSTLYMSVAFVDQKKNFYKQSILSKEIELNQLKAQLNPHFLFNALNNIYSYNLENDRKGNDLILKLSQLMRYIVEVNEKKSVSLQEELQFISDYVALEKERLGHRCTIRFAVDWSNRSIPIEPLVFFPLIENAFKHSASTNVQSFVEIRITQTESELIVNVSNSIPPGSQKESTKIGLSNVRRRLQLLYPERHSVSVVNDGRQFHVSLCLQYS